MSTEKERTEFTARLAREYPNIPVHIVCDLARKLMSLARTHGNLAVQQCNGPPEWIRNRERSGDDTGVCDAWETARAKREESCERRITEVCAKFGHKPDCIYVGGVPARATCRCRGKILKPHFGGDPRGYTVKVKLPSGVHNTFGGSEEGYGVPQ